MRFEVNRPLAELKESEARVESDGIEVAGVL